MMIKYRVHEVAKDLNVPSKDIITLLGKHFDTPKKHMTALTEEELNVVFEHFTQKNQVESFDAYFASGKKEEVDEKEQPKEEKIRFQQKNRSRCPLNLSKTRSLRGRNRGSKMSAIRKAVVLLGSRTARIHRPAIPRLRPFRNPVLPVLAAAHVDMRTSQVNLDKYNEKYDNIATSSIGNKDTGVKKQKLTQRSAQRGRPQFPAKIKKRRRCVVWRWSGKDARNWKSLFRMKSR